jgi:shikimate 5-dehydrogenase
MGDTKMAVQTRWDKLIVPPKPGEKGRPQADSPYKPIEMSFFDQVVSFFSRLFNGVTELIQQAADTTKQVLKDIPEITRSTANALPFAAAIAFLVIADRTQKK